MSVRFAVPHAMDRRGKAWLWVVKMMRFVVLAAIGGAAVHASGVLDDGPAQFSLMLLPLSAAVAWVLIGVR